MSDFFSRLSYSFGNEDWSTEQKALQLKSTDRVVCITASGDRPLHLLLGNVAEVVSVDANPFQNELLRLKIAALRTWDYDTYLTFLGANHHKDRRELFNVLLSHLSETSVAFWKKHYALIDKGILYQGKTERCCSIVAAALSLTRGRKVRKLFAFDDLEAQQRFLRDEWNTPLWKAMVGFSLHPKVTRLFIQDPGLYAHLGQNIKPSAYILDRMNASLHRLLARENVIVSLTFAGKVFPEGYPPYLQREASKYIKEQMHKISPVDSEIHAYLSKAPKEHFDAFSLSDVVSFISRDQFTSLLQEIVRTARPGARFCIRQFMSDYQIPDYLNAHFQREAALERELEQEDRCFVYRFMVGTVQKA